MKTDKKILKSATMIAGALLTSSLTMLPASGMDVLAYNDLGSGATVRTHLIDANARQVKASEASTYKFVEQTCGEDAKKKDAKEGETKKAETKKAEAKQAEAKKGEATCGEDGKKAKAKKSESESKSKEAKCGEGKCG